MQPVGATPSGCFARLVSRTCRPSAHALLNVACAMDNSGRPSGSGEARWLALTRPALAVNETLLVFLETVHHVFRTWLVYASSVLKQRGGVIDRIPKTRICVRPAGKR